MHEKDAKTKTTIKSTQSIQKCTKVLTIYKSVPQKGCKCTGQVQEMFPECTGNLQGKYIICARKVPKKIVENLLAKQMVISGKVDAKPLKKYLKQINKSIGK